MIALLVSSNQVLYFATLFPKLAAQGLFPHDDVLHFGVIPYCVEDSVIRGRHIESLKVRGGGCSDLGVTPDQAGLHLDLFLSYFAILEEV